MATFLVELHAFPVKEAEQFGVPMADNDGREFEALRAAVLPLLHEVLNGNEYDTLGRWCDDFLSDVEVDRFRPVLRHGDLWYGNVLVDESTARLVGVLDWENAAIGDPACDLARQLHAGKPFAEAVLRSYEARSRIDRGLGHRIERRWELLEFAGIRTAAELNDPAELEDAIGKLRTGPILAS